MPEQRRQTSRTWLAAGLIVALTLPLFVWGLGDRNIWIPLEARYALVAREMWQAGHWVLPHLGGQVYADKPPFLFWVIALIAALGPGVTEWTARLPAALAGVGVCLMTWRLGTRLFSSTAGILAALVLATSAGFFWSGRQALPDMLLTLWMTGAFWALWEWVAARRRKAVVMAGLCLGLATLTKGPVGLLLPLLTTLVYLTLRRDWHLLRSWQLTVCLGTSLGLTLAWYLPAVWQGGIAYVQLTLLHHSLERYVNAWEHTAPWYFYFGAFPAEFLPWMLFLPQAFIFGRPRRDQQASPGWWFAVCWLVTILVFFSVSTGKRDIYILPAYPAAALLVGWVWSSVWTAPPGGAYRWALSLPALVLALGLWGVAGGMWAAIPALLPSKSMLLLPIAPEVRLWTGGLLAVGGSLLAGAALTQRLRLIYSAILGCTWFAMIAAVAWIYTPQFNQRYPVKPFATAIRNHSEPGKTLHLCGSMNDLALRFHVGRFIPSLLGESEIAGYLGADREALCVMDLAGYRRLGELTGHHWPILARQEIGRAVLLLVSNQP